MTKAPPVLARVYRGSRVESAHRGWVAVVDERGAVLASCGDASAPVFTRSAAKPFQAMPLLSGGGARKFRLGDAAIALICASHGGEPRHVKAAQELLKRGGFGVRDLLCGAHPPMHEPSARDLIRRGKVPSALHNNCSGQHAGLLLTCRLLGMPHADYTDAAHPLQRQIESVFAEQAGLRPSEMKTAVDGCGLPVFRVPLAALAAAYARLMVRRLPGEDPAAASVRARLVRAMTRHPEMLAGAGRFTTDFVAAGRGRWIGKEGAEGVYAVAVAARGKTGRALGIALKIEDGSSRSRDAVTLDVLDKLEELPPEIRRALADYAEPRLYNARGREVGRIEVDAPLRMARARPRAIPGRHAGAR